MPRTMKNVTSTSTFNTHNYDYIHVLADTEQYLARDILKMKTTYFRGLCEYWMIMMLLQIEEDRKKRTQRRRRSVWVRPYLRRLAALGQFDNLMKEVSLETPELYSNFMRLGKMFNETATTHERSHSSLRFWRQCSPELLPDVSSKANRNSVY
ncbi:hypothetical protein E2C01_057371 [Portunus trituberculatus]|uniref:Uncharacterized protein n=1 Tax=Portunus trituberculatus TaxID=210409 RepID=A0A5B7H0V9_PORTR|nr:hypothetical protein [Portunus trituberculatus]